MKQTAVEWLVDYLTNIKELPFIRQDLNINEQNILKDIIDQAKEMEKEQICNAWYNSLTKGDYNSADEYYNETYKTETIVTEYRDGTIDVETFE